MLTDYPIISVLDFFMEHSSNFRYSKHVTKEDLFKQINGAAVCCCVMESILTAGFKLWTVPSSLANQAREAQKRAQVRKNLNNKEKDKRSVGFVFDRFFCGFAGVGSRGDGFLTRCFRAS